MCGFVCVMCKLRGIGVVNKRYIPPCLLHFLVLTSFPQVLFRLFLPLSPSLCLTSFCGRSIRMHWDMISLNLYISATSNRAFTHTTSANLLQLVHRGEWVPNERNFYVQNPFVESGTHETQYVGVRILCVSLFLNAVY